MKFVKKLLKISLIGLELFFGLLLCLLLFIFIQIRIAYPDVPEVDLSTYKIEQTSENEWTLKDSWLRKNEYGVWEIYVAGDPYERGIKYGLLTKQLMEEQEDYFVNQINEIIPNSFYLNFLKMFVGWFNKDMPDHISEEYQKEIYGVSLSFSKKYQYIAPNYYRILNYHAAHDIGHALKDLSMVGCTSFGAVTQTDNHSNLIIGRNFDFYMGDDFAKDKLITFMNPTEGFKYVSYSWAGLMGVVSGMNEKGLTITLNAAKSTLPMGAKTPISLLAREILQYASNFEEAIAIAKKRDVFVSETFMIGSAEDNGVVLIEKSPDNIDVYRSNTNKTICANHYQSDQYKSDELNIENIKNSDSKYRYNLMDSLVKASDTMTPQIAANILRFQQPEKGMGNPMQINQMIAHHACIFEPNKQLVWYSTSPYQMGKFVCYDLNALFNNQKDYIVDSLIIDEDPFIYTSEFNDYEFYKTIKLKIFKHVGLGISYTLTKETEDKFINSNPNCYITYMSLGEYYLKEGKNDIAKKFFTQSLTKAVSSLEEVTKIKNYITECH